MVHVTAHVAQEHDKVRTLRQRGFFLGSATSSVYVDNVDPQNLGPLTLTITAW